jgi:DNA topoisomerase-1
MRPRHQSSVAAEPEAARKAGLKYLNSGRPGIRRVRVGRGFGYEDHHGRRIVDPEVLQRIHGLVIPPAWTEVWICRHPQGHLQAVGRDARGRKQYRYHTAWRVARDESKFGRMLEFAATLPRIRRRVARDLREPGLGRQKVLAALVRLLDLSAIRVGNAEYARDNGSFGLTTLRNRHVRVNGSRIDLEFVGKGSKQHHLSLAHRRVANIVRQCQDLPGQQLFQYVAEGGRTHHITSDAVNAYIAEVAGREFTSKDFRTWKATVVALKALRRCEPCERVAGRKRNVVRALEQAAARLGNTVAICRKCYVHPGIVDAYLKGSLAGPRMNSSHLPVRGLTLPERDLAAWLQQARSRAG